MYAQTQTPPPGRWTRLAIRHADGRCDRTTEVLWLQGPRWFVDLRLPADRPDFGGVRGLAECDATRRAWLARQEGFAGVLDSAGPWCLWHRQIDFGQPGLPDAGRMETVDADGLWLESGVHDAYEEDWRHHPEPDLEDGKWLLPGSTPGSHGLRQLIIVRAGGMALCALGSGVPPALAPRPWSPECAIARLGLVDGHWRVERCTLPWLEGHCVAASGQPIGALAAGCAALDGATDLVPVAR